MTHCNEIGMLTFQFIVAVGAIWYVNQISESSIIWEAFCKMLEISRPMQMRKQPVWWLLTHPFCKLYLLFYLLATAFEESTSSSGRQGWWRLDPWQTLHIYEDLPLLISSRTQVTCICTSLLHPFEYNLFTFSERARCLTPCRHSINVYGFKISSIYCLN